MQKQAKILQTCVGCLSPSRPNAIRYLLSDMANEMVMKLKQKLCEVNEQSWLCEGCFNTFWCAWLASQESGMEDFAAAMETDPDPLCVSTLMEKEIKEEAEEPEITQHYDYKVEIDTSQQSSHLKTLTKTLEDDERNSTDSEELTGQGLLDVMQDQNSDEENKSSDSEEDETELHRKTPPLLNGSSLKSGTKCDTCPTIISKTQYREVPDGPVKDHMVVKCQGNREVSPERVCNVCWKKAHNAVVKAEKKHTGTKQEESKQEESKSELDTIIIPGYRRFPSSTNHCMIHGCKNKDSLQVPDYLRLVLMKFYNIYTPESARVCKEHCKDYVRDWSFLKEHPYLSEFNQKDVNDMLNLLRVEALKHPE